MEVYLDNAATSHPKPPEVISAVHEALTELNGNPGRSGHARALAGSRLLMETRQAIAELINAPQPECIVFCLNCTDALNMAIKGTLNVGNHVITSGLEHNSVLRILEELRFRGLISVTYIAPEANGTVNPDHFLSALRPTTRLCVLTHASNVTGVVQPVAEVGEIMHRNGVVYLVDGAQSIGHIPVDVQMLKCNLYASPGHKGLLAPPGTGFLYIAPEQPLRAFREGGTGSSSNSVRQPSERPECFESGTVNLPGIAGLLAGVKMIQANQKTYQSQETELSSMLWAELNKLQNVTLYTPKSIREGVGVISFNVGDLSSSETADILSSYNIAVRGGLHCAPYTHRHLGTLARGAVRASVSWQNTHEDIETLLRAIYTLH